MPNLVKSRFAPSKNSFSTVAKKAVNSEVIDPNLEI